MAVAKAKVAFKRSRAHTIYRLQDGTRVPGTTTVCNLLEKPALKAWANRIGLEGYEMHKYMDPLAGVGTLTHARILSEVSGQPLAEDITEYSPKEVDLSDNAMLSFYEWRRVHEYGSIVGCELQLVSEQYRYGGTADYVGYLDDLLTLADYKTGSGIYPDMVIQLAAYRQLVKECLGLDVERAMIINIGRSPDESFDYRVFTDQQLTAGWKLFLCLRQIYDLKKAL